MEPYTSAEQPKKKRNWLAALVVLLVFLLVAQSAAVIYFLTRPQKTATTAGLIPADQSLPYVMPQARPRTTAVSPYARGAASHYEPMLADAMTSLGRLEDHFNRMLSQWMAGGPAMSDFFGGADDFDFMPTVDFEEDDKNYVVKVDLPGLDKDKINITVREDILTIQGVRQVESRSADDQTGVYRQERSYGTFARSLQLPGPVDDTQISADYKNGVLTIRLPKLAGSESQPKKIPVQ